MTGHLSTSLPAMHRPTENKVIVASHLLQLLHHWDHVADQLLQSFANSGG